MCFSLFRVCWHPNKAGQAVTCELTIAREAKSLGIDVVLEPFINIDRDVTFGRGYNTFGEDPVLT